MAENIRELILDALLVLEKGGQYSHALVRDVLDKHDYLDGKDKAFFKRVTEGTVERRLELDHYLDCFSTVPVHRMKPLVRCLLRMSVYQLVYMDQVPDSAVCNEACKLAARRKFGSLKGFVNGVLRNVARNRENLPLPDREKEPVRYLSVKNSMPEWLVELWLAEYGAEMTETLLQGLLEIHPVSLRFRCGLGQAERERICREILGTGAVVRQGGYLPQAYTLERTESVASLPGFADGAWTVQDVSSALAVEAAGIRKGDFVVDACAAPGGKSILAAEKGARVLSRDVSEEKAALIRENAGRMRADSLEVQVWDATRFDESLAGKADVLLLDVPCSGLGILGKKRDIKYHVSPEGMESLVELQRRIVRVCSGYVKPGGILLYSTCTIHRAENEDVVRFLVRELGFEPVALEGDLPQRLREERSRVLSLCGERGRSSEPPGERESGSTSRNRGSNLPPGERKEESGGIRLTAEEQAACVQFLPGYMEADGFFFAKLRRPEGTLPGRIGRDGQETAGT